MRILLFPFLLLFVCCSGHTQQNDNCYFPINTFLSEKTYCFVNQNDTTEKSYWKMQTIISNSDTILKTSIYDSKNRITELMTENILNGNSNMASYTLYYYDSEGNKLTSECKIADSFVFKAGQGNEEQIQWKVSFKDFSSPNICELTKVRTLKTNIPNKRTFSDQMKFTVIGTNQEYEYSMTSIYQKDKGLISYKLTLPDGKVKDFVLINIK